MWIGTPRNGHEAPKTPYNPPKVPIGPAPDSREKQPTCCQCGGSQTVHVGEGAAPVKGGDVD